MKNDEAATGHLYFTLVLTSKHQRCLGSNLKTVAAGHGRGKGITLMCLVTEHMQCVNQLLVNSVFMAPITASDYYLKTSVVQLGSQHL